MRTPVLHILWQKVLCFLLEWQVMSDERALLIKAPKNLFNVIPFFPISGMCGIGNTYGSRLVALL